MGGNGNEKERGSATTGGNTVLSAAARGVGALEVFFFGVYLYSTQGLRPDSAEKGAHAEHGPG